MKNSAGRFAALACLVFGVVHFSRAGAPWYVSYDQALRAQDKQEWQASIDYLQQALLGKPKPQLKAKTYGLRFVDYLPHFYLGVAHYHLGNKTAALKNFELEEQHGEIKNTSEVYALLMQLRAELKGEKTTPPAREKIAAAAKTEKGRSSTARPEKLPWYVNYEIGIEYIESGDWLRAVEYLKRAVAAKNAPSQYARTYGMWFIAYLPYYYLGLAYYNQGLWQNSVEYLETSERLDELKSMPAESANLQKLLSGSRMKLAGGESTPVKTEEAAEMVNAEIVEAVRLFNEEKFPEAEKKFKAVLQLDPYNSLAKNYLNKMSAGAKPGQSKRASKNDFIAGIAALARGHYDEAITLFNAARPAYENDADFHAYLGGAYAQKYLSTGAKDKTACNKARSAFARALEIDAGYKLDGRVFSKEVMEIFANNRSKE
ncbi:tetratricopeptide repeat protein [candidate division KSB1 bacterium]|nr:tetratricopeptide repeat protein [candidate division KSB1 bacterium]